MRIAYRRMVRIRVRHPFFQSGETHGEFEVVPTPATAALLAARGLRSRRESDGISVFAEVVPGSQPAELLHPLGRDALRLAFELRLIQRALFVATALADFEPGKSVLAFDNLRDDSADGRAYLGDTAAGARMGPGVRLLTRPSFTYAFRNPVTQASIRALDRFGAETGAVSVSAPATAPLTETRLDLDVLLGQRTGRYTIADDQGGSLDAYYDPELESSRPLGIIDIFSRTEPFTPDGSNRVPAAYRFLTGDLLSGHDTFYVELAVRATRWRYFVTKKYEHSGIDPADLSVTGPVAFASPVVTGADAMFRSGALLPLSEIPRNLTLARAGRAVRTLPEPSLDTPLGLDAATGEPLSDLFVNV